MFNQNTFFMNLVLATKRAKDNDIPTSEAAKAALFGSFGGGGNMGVGLLTTIETMKSKENEKELEDQVQVIGEKNKALNLVLEEVNATDITKLQLEIASLNTTLARVQAENERLGDTNVQLTDSYNTSEAQKRTLQLKIDELTNEKATLLGDKLGLEGKLDQAIIDRDGFESKLEQCQKDLLHCQNSGDGNLSGPKKKAK